MKLRQQSHVFIGLICVYVCKSHLTYTCTHNTNDLKQEHVHLYLTSVRLWHTKNETNLFSGYSFSRIYNTSRARFNQNCKHILANVWTREESANVNVKTKYVEVDRNIARRMCVNRVHFNKLLKIHGFSFFFSSFFLVTTIAYFIQQCFHILKKFLQFLSNNSKYFGNIMEKCI